MELTKFIITKRDGSEDNFSTDKIMNAIAKAYEATAGETCSIATLASIYLDSGLNITDVSNRHRKLFLEEYYRLRDSGQLDGESVEAMQECINVEERSVQEQRDEFIEERKIKECSNGSHIGNRVYNHRPQEDHVCELLSDDVVGLLMKECFEKFIGGAFRLIEGMKKLLSLFTLALFNNPDIIEAEKKSDRQSTDEYGKVAHVHRVAERLLSGDIVGCGKRLLQKTISWVKLKVNKALSREYDRHEMWLLDLKEMEKYLNARIPQLVAAN